MIVGFTKFFVFFKIEDRHPEYYDILADQVKGNIAHFTTDELLTCLVNFTHSLSPETNTLFDLACDEFVYRLDSNFNASKRELYLQEEDFIKITNTMLNYRKMSHELKQNIIDYLKDNIDSFKYDVIAELAVIYATKMDDNYKQLFFKYFKEKFFKDLQYLDNENLYKIVWALVKSKQITVNDEGQEWNYVKDAVVAKVKDIDPKTLTNIIVLSTIGKDDIE